MSSGPKTVTTTSKGQQQSTFAPNAAAQPMYGWLGGLGQNLMQQPTPFYPGQTYAGPSAATQQGIGGMSRWRRARPGYCTLPGLHNDIFEIVVDGGRLRWAAD